MSGLFLRSSVCVILSTSLHVYRRSRKVIGARINHQPPPSYLSVVLRSLSTSHLPLLPPNTPLSWLHPPSSIQNLLKCYHLEKSRHGYALNIRATVVRIVCIGYVCTTTVYCCTYSVWNSVPWSTGYCTYTVVLMCNVLTAQ